MHVLPDTPEPTDGGIAQIAHAPRAQRSVIVVAPDPLVRELLAAQLRAAGCFPLAVPDAQAARRLAQQVLPNLILLDLDAEDDAPPGWWNALPATASGRHVLSVMLSSDPPRQCGEDGAACGADLCVAKPFEPRELVMQLLRLMRPPRERALQPRARPPLKAPGIELLRDEPTVRLLLPEGWRSLDLPKTEHRLLAYLLSEGERARSREAIRDAVWRDAPVDVRTVDQYVRRLRSTLEAAGARGLVKTVSGVGYRLDLAALSASGGP